MAKNLKGLAEYEFWRWEYQRRNQGYRDAVDQLVALVSARAKSEGVYPGVTLADLLTSDKHTEHLRQLLKTPFVTGDCLTESPFTAFITPEEFIEFIKTHKRIPDHYSWGFSGQELLAQDELDLIPGQFEPSSFHVPSFHVIFSFPEGGEARIDLSIPLDVDIDLVQLEFAYVHALGKVRGSARYVVPDEPNGHAGTVATALDALRGWWRVKRSNERARYSALPRAVGLWLYDYAKREGAAATKAAHAFSLAYQDQTGSCRLGRQFDDDHHVMRLLQSTRKCVETIEVLPMKSGRKQKVVS